jgi:hypothetical protein
VTDGEPDTSRDVSPVRGGAFENLLQKCRKALGAYSTMTGFPLSEYMTKCLTVTF